MKNRLYRFLLLGVIGLATAGLIAYVQIQTEKVKVIEGPSIVSKNFGGPLNLIDQDGNNFTNQNFEEGQYRLIYFGFTYCTQWIIHHSFISLAHKTIY